MKILLRQLATMIALITLVPHWCQSDESLSQSIALENSAINARKSIDTMVLDAHFIAEEHHRGQTTKSGWNRRFWVDRDKLRCDEGFSASPSDDSCVTTTCFGCMAGDQHVHYSKCIPMPGAEYSITVTDLDKLSERAYLTPDPRWFGLKPVMTLEWGREPPKTPADELQREIVVAEESLHGVPCRRIESNFGNGTIERTWYSTQHDGFIVKSEVAWNLPGFSASHSVESVPKRDEEAGIYYPQSVAFRRVNGGVTTHTEELTLNVKSINLPVDPSVFSLQGIAPRDGARIHWVSSLPRPVKGEMEWKNNKFESITYPGTPMKRHPRSPLMSIFLLGNAIFLIVCGIFLLIKRKRNPTYQ